MRFKCESVSVSSKCESECVSVCVWVVSVNQSVSIYVW